MEKIVEILTSFYEKLLDITGQILPWIESREYRSYVVAGAGIALIFLLYRLFLSGSRKKNFTLPPPGKQLSKREKEKYRKIAEGLVKEGDITKAADIYRIIGEIPRAVELYHKSGKTIMAAQLASEHNLNESAALLYEKAGRFMEAAEEWEKAGNYQKAVEAYLKEKSFVKAAELLSRINQHEKAAEVYERGEYLEKAIEEYIKAKNYKKASQLLYKVYRDEKKSLESQQSMNPNRIKDLKKLALKTATYLELAGEYERAMEMYEEGGNYAKAAEIAGILDMWEKAAEYYHMAGLPLKAAEIYEKLGDKKRAAQIRAEVYEKEGDELSAAESYLQSGDYLSAAEIFKRHGKYSRAGELYLKAGDYALAADMFATDGKFEKAAMSYEKAGDYLAAADMYRKANNIKKVIEMLIKGGQIVEAVSLSSKSDTLENAVKLLEQLKGNSEELTEAVTAVLKVYLERNQWEEAKKIYEKYNQIEVRRNNLDIMYTLAARYEKEGDYEKAFDIYRKFIDKKLFYKDVKQKYELLRAKLETKKITGEKNQESSSESPGVQKGRKRYQILRELGRGGMGVVYQAHDTVLDRIVALKVLPLSLRLNPIAIANFKSEAKKAAALNHPNIVTIYDYGEDDGEYYLVMEYIDGITLRDYIKRKGRLNLKEVLFIGVSVAKGLAYAHRSNLIHRDIKPSNIMISIKDKEWRVKIADFGLARAWQDTAQHQTMVVGTPYYMSPEQFLGEKVDERSDIYSFGATLYEMVTGEVPFKKGEIGFHHVHTPPTPPSEIVPDVDKGLERIILKCMEKDPNDRFQNMEEVIAAFKEIRGRMSKS